MNAARIIATKRDGGELTDAEIGYLEIYDPADPRGVPMSITHGVAPDDAKQLEERVSRGIIAQAMATGIIEEPMCAPGAMASQ